MRLRCGNGYWSLDAKDLRTVSVFTTKEMREGLRISCLDYERKTRERHLEDWQREHGEVLVPLGYETITRPDGLREDRSYYAPLGAAVFVSDAEVP